MGCLLQKIRTNFGKLPLLFGGDDWLCFIKPVRDQVVQLLPVLHLKGKQPQLRFESFLPHERTLTNSIVSSSFCRLSIKRCAQGRSTVCTWLMIPSSK